MRRLMIVLVLLALVGCSKLTAENYAKIEMGMSLQQISAILGQPERCDDVAGFQSCQWGKAAAAGETAAEGTSISVQFVGDRAVMRSGTNLR